MKIKSEHLNEDPDGESRFRELLLPDNLKPEVLIGELVRFLDGWAVDDDLVVYVNGVEVKR